MSYSWDASDRYEARVEACPGHELEQVPREEQERTRDYRSWRCVHCHWLLESVEKRAYEMGVKAGIAQEVARAYTAQITGPDAFRVPQEEVEPLPSPEELAAFVAEVDDHMNRGSPTVELVGSLLKPP